MKFSKARYLFILLVILICFGIWHGIQPYIRGNAPQFHFKNLRVQEVLYYYNPPTGMDGVTFAVYQLKNTDLKNWVKQTNQRVASEKHSASIDTRFPELNKQWVRGSIKDKNLIQAVEYPFSGEDAKEAASHMPWKEWIRSPDCYFLYNTMKYTKQPDGKRNYSDVSIWILDVKNRRAFLIARNI